MRKPYSGLDLVDANRGGAAIAEAQFVCCGFAEVDDTAAVERAAIIDGDLDGAAGALVGDAQLGAEGKRAVSRRHGILVEDLTRGGAFAVETRSIPGCATTLGIGRDGGNRKDSCGDRNGGNDFSDQASELAKFTMNTS